jgi:hypothetical protein
MFNPAHSSKLTLASFPEILWQADITTSEVLTPGIMAPITTSKRARELIIEGHGFEFIEIANFAAGEGAIKQPQNTLCVVLDRTLLRQRIEAVRIPADNMQSGRLDRVDLRLVQSLEALIDFDEFPVIPRGLTLVFVLTP